jgi:hypothetical protein
MQTAKEKLALSLVKIFSQPVKKKLPHGRHTFEEKILLSWRMLIP